MQTLVPVADAIVGTFPAIFSANPEEAVSPPNVIFLSKVGGTDWWECVNEIDDTSYIDSSISLDEGFAASWVYIALLDTPSDPGVDTGFKLIMRFRVFNIGTDFSHQVAFSISTTDYGNAIISTDLTIQDGIVVNADPAEMADAVGVNFVTVEYNLTELQVQGLRALGFFSSTPAIFISGGAQSFDVVSPTLDFDISYVAIELPGTSPDPVIEITSDAGVEAEGGHANYFISETGVVADAGGVFWTNEIIADATVEANASGIYGTNEIVSDAGLVAGAGGRDFYLIAPDISGIYVLVPNKRYDTWYDRSDLPNTTIDAKIPNPFVSLAYLPKD